MLLPPAQPHSFYMLQVQLNTNWYLGEWDESTRGNAKMIGKTQNGNFIPLLHLWCLSAVNSVTMGAGACRSPCIFIHLSIINTTLSTFHCCHSGATSQWNIKPPVAPIAATLCKYINCTAFERGHYQPKCEQDWYAKHYHTTCSRRAVSQVLSEYVCVSRWRYQDVNCAACQGRQWQMVCVKGNLNLLTIWIYCVLPLLSLDLSLKCYKLIKSLKDKWSKTQPHKFAPTR